MVKNIIQQIPTYFYLKQIVIDIERQIKRVITVVSAHRNLKPE